VKLRLFIIIKDFQKLLLVFILTEQKTIQTIRKAQRSLNS